MFAFPSGFARPFDFVGDNAGVAQDKPAGAGRRVLDTIEDGTLYYAQKRRADVAATSGPCAA